MKMKNILNSLFPWLAMTTLLSLQGCENEEGTAIHSRDTVSFEIDAGGARATETTFETGDAIGVYAAVRMSSAPATLKTSGNYARFVSHTVVVKLFLVFLVEFGVVMFVD